MTIQIQFFGMIAEALNCANHTIEDYEKQTLGELEQDVLALFPELSNFSYQLALNKKIAQSAALLGADNEVAVLPPFAGG